METKQPKTNVNKPACNNIDIFTAVKSGNVSAVEEIVEGSEVLTRYDQDGHTLAHWVCFHGNVDMLHLMLRKGGSYDGISRVEGGQRPVHWAAHQGHMHVLQALFDLGIAVDTADNYGKTPLLIAAQNGKTAAVAYLISLNANTKHADKDGDTALHWAAYNGHTETMRLLVYMGFNVEQTDIFLQTPLHIASLRGHLVAVRDLCVVDNADTTKLDKNNETPRMLALRKGKLEVMVELDRIESRKRKSFWPRSLKSVVDGSFMSGKNTLLIFICIFVCAWGYPIYVIDLLIPYLNDLSHYHLIFFLLNIVFWASIITTNHTDPAFVTTNQPQYSHTMQNLSSQSDFQQVTQALSRLCHTCRAVKPLRSKHCRHCNRCVQEFDHHCFYVGNCVGKGNRASFMLFVNTVFILMCLSLRLAYILIQLGEASMIVWMGSCILLVFMVLSGLVSMSILINISRGLTTNEAVNWRRYKYLVDKEGNYCNKYNKGFRKNFLEHINMGEDGLWRSGKKHVGDLDIV